MKLFYDENICVRCLACVSESEFGGVSYERGHLRFDETKSEDWQNIIAICPVAALKFVQASDNSCAAANDFLLR